MLTVGPPEADEQLRYALSVGAGAAVLVTTDGRGDPDAAGHGSRAGREPIARARGRDGPFDLILFGNESADAGGFQVGIRVARALGRPVVNGIKGIELDGDGGSPPGARPPTASRSTGLTLPAVLGVKEGINLPRYPTLPGRLRSKKAEVRRADRGRRARGAAHAGLRPAGRAGDRDHHPRHRRRTRPRPSSTCCWSSASHEHPSRLRSPPDVHGRSRRTWCGRGGHERPWLPEPEPPGAGTGERAGARADRARPGRARGDRVPGARPRSRRGGPARRRGRRGRRDRRGGRCAGRRGRRHGRGADVGGHATRPWPTTRPRPGATPSRRSPGPTGASAVVAVGTDRGNEVLAHVAAVEDLPFAANATAVTVADGPWELTRTRWGGSLLERSTLDGAGQARHGGAARLRRAGARPRPDAAAHRRSSRSPRSSADGRRPHPHRRARARPRPAAAWSARRSW